MESNNLPAMKRARHNKSTNNKRNSTNSTISFQVKSEKIFPKWDTNIITIPSIFRHDAEGIPLRTPEKGAQAALKGPRKEKDFLEKLNEFGSDKSAIVLHSLKFRELFDQYNKLLSKHKSRSPNKQHQLHASEAFRQARHYVPAMNELAQEAEIDFLLLVKSKGIFIFEVKSSVGERHHAKEQLAIRQALLKFVVSDAIKEGELGDWTPNDIPMYCSAIFPSSERPSKPPYHNEYFEDNFSSKQHWTDWWVELVECKPTLTGDCDTLFYKIVSRLIYTVTYYMPLTLSEGIVEVGDDIQQQKVLKTFGSMPKIVYDLSRNGEPRSTKLTNEQVVALSGPQRQIIIGPTGSGKTLIIAAKALELSRQGKRVIVVCGDRCEGLVYWYLKVLGLNECYGHDHLEHVFVCSMQELLQEFQMDVVEGYCLVDEVSGILEVLSSPSPRGHSVEYQTLWNNIFRKPFLWLAASDSCSVYESVLDTGERHPFHVVRLDKVLRNTVSIFNEFIDQTASGSPPEVGHDVEGLAVQRLASTSMEEVSEQVKELITGVLHPKCDDACMSRNLREMDYKDILVYISLPSSTSTKRVKGVQGVVSRSIGFEFVQNIVDSLHREHIPLKYIQGGTSNILSGNFFQDPLSDSVMIAWQESDILSLEFVAVISCELGCEATAPVLSRAVSQLFRISCDRV